MNQAFADELSGLIQQLYSDQGQLPSALAFSPPPEALRALLTEQLQGGQIELAIHASPEETAAQLLGPLLAAIAITLDAPPSLITWVDGAQASTLTLRDQRERIFQLNLRLSHADASALPMWSWRLIDHDGLAQSGEAHSPKLSGAFEVAPPHWLESAQLAARAMKSGVAQRGEAQSIAASAYLHPTVEVAGPVEVGEGTKIWHFSKLLGPLTIGERCSLGQNVVVERGVTLGNNVKVQNNVSIYAGVILEDDVFCGPSMVFTNVGTPRSHYPRRGEYQETRIGRGASIGANATVVCGHSLGPYAFIGAGAVVTRDIPAYALAYGNPARVKGWACYCGERLPMRVDEGSEQCQCENCGRRYRRKGERVEEALD